MFSAFKLCQYISILLTKKTIHDPNFNKYIITNILLWVLRQQVGDRLNPVTFTASLTSFQTSTTSSGLITSSFNPDQKMSVVRQKTFYINVLILIRRQFGNQRWMNWAYIRCILSTTFFVTFNKFPGFNVCGCGNVQQLKWCLKRLHGVDQKKNYSCEH